VFNKKNIFLKYVYIQMEATTSAVEDSLINSLDFKIKPGASYIIGRRNCSFFPSGGNNYSPSGVRVLLYHLSDGWLDPSSVRIMYTLVNDHEPDPAETGILKKKNIC
jgi:hypothetical protein